MKEALTLARQSLAAFATLIDPTYQVPDHIFHIAAILDAVRQGKHRRVMITIPPRHGKSKLTSAYFPSHYFGLNPKAQIIFTTYSQEFAEDWGRAVRMILTNQTYKAIFPRFQLNESVRAANRIMTKEGGTYFAVGAGGAITGRGADLLIIDDPVKNREEAESETYRRRIKEWFTSTAYTRLMPGGAIIIIQTRWHDDDLTGWLLRDKADENWLLINMPAIAEPDDVLGRKEGEPLWPERYGLETLSKIRETVGSRDWAALYQQRPVLAEGAIIKEQWLKYYDEFPQHFRFILQSIDTTAKGKEEGDPSVILTLGVGDLGIYILDEWRKACEQPEFERAVVDQAAKWRPNKIIGEAMAMWIATKQRLKETTLLPVDDADPHVAGSKVKYPDKTVRMKAETPLMESGKVYLPNPKIAPWVRDFIYELLTFPQAAHDDRVDALSQGLKWLRENYMGNVSVGGGWV